MNRHTIYHVICFDDDDDKNILLKKDLIHANL